MSKSRLHEVLAVEGDLEGSSKKVVAEAINTFTKKNDHFMAFNKTYHPFREGKEHEMPSEQKELVTTVEAKLNHAFNAVNSYYDAVAQKECTNQTAKADLIVNGVCLAKDLPATFLLGLETKLKDLRKLVEVVPTLQPGVTWEEDKQLGEGVFKSAVQQERMRTEKRMKPVVLYEATDKHPAQVKESTEDVAIGKYVQTDWSGMISPAAKSRMLARADALIQGVKKARQRANQTEVVNVQIGKVLTDFIAND